MIDLGEYRQQYIEEVQVNDNRRYQVGVYIDTPEEIVVIDNSTITDLSVEESSSVDTDLEIGTANIGKMTLTFFNRLPEAGWEYMNYDYVGRNVQVVVDLTVPYNGTQTDVRLSRGRYIVDSQRFDGNTITLECLDYMSKLDMPYTSALVFPATVNDVIMDACDAAGLTFSSDSTIPHSDMIVLAKPESADITFRKMLSYVGQIIGTNFSTDGSGRLRCGWYDTGALGADIEGNLQTEDEANILAENGNSLVGEIATEQDLELYNNLVVLPALYTLNVARHDTTITGVTVVAQDSSSGSLVKEYKASGSTDGYVVKIENNPLVTKNNAQEIADWLGDQLIGMTWRKAQSTHLSTSYMEAGDIALLTDGDGKRYHTLVTYTKWSPTNKQGTRSAAADPARKAAEPYSWKTQALQAVDQSMTQSLIYNKLVTDDGSSTGETYPEDQGLILKDGKLYFNAEYLRGNLIEGLLIRTLLSDQIYQGVTGEYKFQFEFSSEGLKIKLVPTEETAETAQYQSSPSSIITPLMMSDSISGIGAIDYPLPSFGDVKLGTIYYDDSESSLHQTSINSLVTAIEQPLFVVRSYTYSYTVTANGSVNVSKNNLGWSAINLYTFIGFTGISTANANVVPRSWNPDATAAGACIVLRNVGSSSVTSTLTVKGIFLKTAFID